MTVLNTKSIDVNTLDVDNDGKADHVTLRVSQIGDQDFSVRTFVATAKDNFKLTSDTTQAITIDTVPGWNLSSLKFQNHKLVLLGKNPSNESSNNELSLKQLGLHDSFSHTDLDSQQSLDHEVSPGAGVLGALRDNTALNSALSAPGLKPNTMKDLDSSLTHKQTQYGSSTLGLGTPTLHRDDDIMNSLGGLDTKGTVTGTSGYGTSKDTLTLGTLTLGKQDTTLVDAEMKRYIGQIRDIYNAAIKKYPDLTGKVSLLFTIDGNGKVIKAEIVADKTSWNNPEAGEAVNKKICERFLRFQFAAPKGGSIMIVPYSFDFSSN